jgi:hypothetical protein
VGKLLFGEERRHTKIIPHAFGRTRVLKLMYAALIRCAGRWRGIGITELEQHQLKATRDGFNTAERAPQSERYLSSIH